MIDVTKVMSQFLHTWHADDINMWQCLVMEKTFNQLREKTTDFVWSKVCIPLPFIVQSKFEFELMYDHDNGFHTLMAHLVEPDRKYKGDMQHKMIKIQDLELTVASDIRGVVVGNLHSSLYSICFIVIINGRNTSITTTITVGSCVLRRQWFT